MKRFIALIAFAAILLPATISCNKENEDGSKGGVQVMLEQSATEITKTASFKVNLTEAVSSTVVVTLAAVEGSGYVSADYLEFPSAVTIQQGATSKSVTVTVRPAPAGKTPLPAGTYKVAIKIANATNATAIDGADVVSFNYVRIINKPYVTLEYDEEFDEDFVDGASRFIVSLTEEAYENVTVTLSLGDTPSVAGCAPLTREAFKQFSETITITPGQTEYQVSVILDPEKLTPNRKNEALIKIDAVSENAQIGATNNTLSLFAQGPVAVENMEGVWKAEYVGLDYNEEGALVYGIETSGMEDEEYYLVRFYDYSDDPVTDDVIKGLITKWVDTFAQYEGVTADDVCYQGEDLVSFALKNGPGKYQMFMLGFEEDLTPNYKYLVYDFEVEDTSVEATYEDFLGNWNLLDNYWVVTEKEHGKSYNVTGLKSQDRLRGEIKTVEALFENGKFVLMEQKLGSFHANEETNFNMDYGMVDEYLTGIWYNGDDSYWGYPTNTDAPGVICTGELQKDGTVLVIGGSYTIEFTNGTYDMPIDEIAFCWIVQEGTYAGRGNNYSPTQVLPAALEKAGEVSDAYSKWIGDWSLPSVDYIFNNGRLSGTEDGSQLMYIMPGRVNETYNVLGLGEDNSYYGLMTGFFDDETGSFVMVPQAFEKWVYTPENGPEEEVYEILVGNYVNEEGEDMWSYSSKEILFTASFDDDNTASLTPGEHSSGILFNGFQRLQGVVEDGDLNFYLRDCEFVLPNTMTREVANAAPAKRKSGLHGSFKTFRRSGKGISVSKQTPVKSTKVSARSFKKVSVAKH